MGEIADGIINGDTCPCGKYLGNGNGFPQHCSSICNRDFGGGQDFVHTPRYKSFKSYRGAMDKNFFKGMDIKVVQNQPWQFSLYHPDLPEGEKFVWYPRKGTLMFETEYGNKKVGEFLDCEEVWKEINKKVIK